MHLNEADSELLKKWIIKKLEDISDADSDVLADYVLALAKTDDPESVAKTNCIENLRDFLLDNAEPFVNELFQAIATKSFDPSRPPLKPAAPVYQPPKRASAELPRLPNESRKRSYHDWDREDGSNTNGRIQSFQGNDRPVKQLKRGGRGYDQRGGWQSQRPMQQHSLSSQHMPQLPSPPPGMPPIDPNNPMAAFLAMQQAMGFFPGMANGGSPQNGSAFAPPITGQRCRDYDTKGFCAAGASCPYEHGNDPFVIPGQEYDPTNAGLFNITPSRVGQVDVSQGERGRGRGRARGRGGGTFRGGGKRSDFSHIGPNRDSSVTSIVVEQIPEDKCNEQAVRDFFAEFGEIEEVTLQQDRRLAIVKYDSHGAARAAYESPKVVFDNRFVKVYWYKPEKHADLSDGTTQFVATGTKPQDVEMGDDDDDQLDLAEATKRQEEAQRKHDESKKQREEAAKQKRDVEAKLKEMEAERKKMAELLAKKTGKAASPTIKVESESGTEENEQTKALKAHLAQLEAEAKSMGLDPDDGTTNGFNGYSAYRGRGGYRGRARGRGRGHFPGYRGGWAGAGSKGGAVMRLDNRLKTVAVTFLEGSFNTHDEALRQFLLFNSLDSAKITKHSERDDTALISFSQRFEGENFMAAARNSELLHIGKVELSWYKPDDNAHTTNGHVDPETKVVIAETSDQPSSDVREAEDENVEDEDLDRWT
ncbi:hypothetical protein LTR37_014211 [Vermiconidia calcicola]|uniref:Uncharacterized protein n=1 Tax=Vermiconidia calcicola TaxID=1690605 RepID=A0ACC3MV09_9PEZI|nr:hypothetical protein LTR37_014211 [Vermiconidia calcicola]